jgi:hypothetical protein
MPSLSCTGRDGVARTFEYTPSRNVGGGFTFVVRTIPPPSSGDFFELTLEEVDATTVRVVMANHYSRPEYAAMGIPEALLPEVKRALGREVESSPAAGATLNVRRSPEATKYWKRLVAMGGAVYDRQRDVYAVV